MKPFPKLPNPHPDHAGRNFVERKSKEAFSRIAKLWQPSGEENETTHSTVSRYAQYLIDRITGKAYSADELMAMPVLSADITDPENIVTNARVVSAIEGDAGAIRTAAETISRAEYESLMTALLDPVASAYQLATGIDLANASDLSAFMRGLDSIGVAASFVDGYALQSRFQKASGSTAYSLRQQANLAITGSPTRHRNGFLFSNSDPTSPASPQRLYGTFPTMTGEWTVISVAVRDREATTASGQRRAFQGLRTAGDGGLSFVTQMQNSSNWQSYTYAGGSAASINGPGLPAEYRWTPTAMRNAATSAADSLSTDNINDSTVKTTTTGRGNVPFQRIIIGAGSSDASTFANYYDGMVSVVLVFNSILTDAQLVSVNDLVNRTIARRVKWIFDGDSISTTDNGWSWGLQTASEWLGRNIELAPIGLGGETTIGATAKIGKQGARFYLQTNVTNGHTLTINGRGYTFKDTLTSADDIKIGASVSATLDNIKAAINAEAGAGTLYGTGTTANADMTAAGSGATGNLYLLRDASLSTISILESGNGALQDMIGTAITTTVPLGPCAELTDPIHSTWYLVQCGSNDPGDTETWHGTLTNLRAMWGAARAAGMKVVATTIPGATTYDTGYWYGSSGDTRHEARNALNAAIRADSANYDVLLDVDDFLADTYGANYWQNTAVLSDGVHPSTATRRAVMNHLWTLVGTQMP